MRIRYLAGLVLAALPASAHATDGVMMHSPYAGNPGVEPYFDEAAIEAAIVSGASLFGIDAGDLVLNFKLTYDDTPMPWTTFRSSLSSTRNVFLVTHTVGNGGVDGIVFERYLTTSARNAAYDDYVKDYSASYFVRTAGHGPGLGLRWSAVDSEIKANLQANALFVNAACTSCSHAEHFGSYSDEFDGPI